MDPNDIEHGFLEELSKIGATSNMLVAQSRSGRRPISVDKMLRKEKDGTLYKFDGRVKDPEEEKKAATRFLKAASSIGNPVVAYADGAFDAAAAKKPKKKGDLPSRDDNESTSTQDGRGSSVVIPGTGTSLVDVAVTATPGGEYR